MDPESWTSSSCVSSLGAPGTEVVLIVYLSAILFMLPFENSSVSNFIPDDRKWASGAMSEAKVATVAMGTAAAKTVAYGVDSFSRVTDFLVASFTASSFISLLLCFSVPVFCFR